MHTLTIRFKNEVELAAWFQEARDLAFIPQDAGCRAKDGLDRERATECLVTARAGIAPWLVAPGVGAVEEDDDRVAA